MMLFSKRKKPCHLHIFEVIFFRTASGNEIEMVKNLIGK
jgi:hypothetical protein